MSQIPSKSQILVIGGGPAGSYTAICLAREGFDVTVFEADTFPRYHIGESLIPSMKTFLEFVDAYDRINAHGFVPKPGGAFKFAHNKREGYTDFKRFNVGKTMSWHVIRSEFDDLLLKYARECGAKVFEKTRVTEVKWEDDDVNKRPYAALWQSETGSGEISFDFVVDASGRNGVISTKHLKHRKVNEALKNTAVWGYWSGCGHYGQGTDRENAIFSETLLDGHGWFWYFPLHDGTMSVGVVQDEQQMIRKKKEFKAIPGNENTTLQDFYCEQFKLAPVISKLMGPNAKLVEVGKDGGPAVRQASDYSYSASKYAGPGYRLVGDAACFIDPYFSSGVHLAFTGALSAAATIASTIRGVPEEDTIKWHNKKIGVAYNRFLMLVLTTYKQIRNQDMDILSAIDHDNFDRAFDFFRPIIQGTHDVNKKVTESEIDDVMNFLRPLHLSSINPMFKDDHYTAQAKLSNEQIQELMNSEEHKKAVKDNEASWATLKKSLNASDEFGSEIINGYTIRMERGKLCMISNA